MLFIPMQSYTVCMCVCARTRVRTCVYPHTYTCLVDQIAKYKFKTALRRLCVFVGMREEVV